MRWKQVSLAGLMAVVAGFYVGLMICRTTVTSSQLVAPAASLAQVDPAFDSPYIRLGMEALGAGRLAQARTYFGDVVKGRSGQHKGYAGLARVACREGDFDEARQQWSNAVNAIKNPGVYGNTISLLYRDMALTAVAHARHDENGAMTHCRVALADLVKAKSVINGSDPGTLYAVEMAMAEVEARMSEIAARDRDQKAALSHRANAEQHVEKAFAINQNDSRAFGRMKAVGHGVPASLSKPGSNGPPSAGSGA